MPNIRRMMMATAGVSAGKNLYTWGENSQGQLGHGNTTDLSSPVQVGSLTDWSIVDCHAKKFMAAIKTDGTLWTWGDGAYGALGHGNTTDLSSPVQVGSLSDWSTIAIGSANAAAIKTDGTLWTWGVNSTSGGASPPAGGALGLGDTTDRSSPVQVGSQTDWALVSNAWYSMFGIKTTGKLYAWGQGSSGNLGLGNATSYSSPVQIGSLTDWSKISSGGGAHAIKTDGTFWSWGNSGGDVHGNVTNLSSPVQVGSQTDWAFITKTHYHGGMGIKTSGKMYSWGRNDKGNLMQNNLTEAFSSSPVQVGSLTDWSTASTLRHYRRRDQDKITQHGLRE